MPKHGDTLVGEDTPVGDATVQRPGKIVALGVTTEKIYPGRNKYPDD